MQRLVPQVLDLARQSARLGIQLTIDAEKRIVLISHWM